MARHKQRRHVPRPTLRASITTMTGTPPKPEVETLLRKNQCRDAIFKLRLDYHKSALKVLEHHLSIDNSVSAFHCMKGRLLTHMATDFYKSSVRIRGEYLTKARKSLSTAASLSPNSSYIAYSHATALFLHGISESRLEFLEAGIQEAERGMKICEPVDPDEDRLDDDEPRLVPNLEGRIECVRIKLMDIKGTMERRLSKRSQDEKGKEEFGVLDEKTEFSSPKEDISPGQEEAPEKMTDIEAPDKTENQTETDAVISQDKEKKQELSDSNEKPSENLIVKEATNMHGNDGMDTVTADTASVSDVRLESCHDNNDAMSLNGSEYSNDDDTVSQQQQDDRKATGCIKKSEDLKPNCNLQNLEGQIRQLSEQDKVDGPILEGRKYIVESERCADCDDDDDIRPSQLSKMAGNRSPHSQLKKKGSESFEMRLGDIERDVHIGLQHMESFSTVTEKRFDQLEARVGTHLNSIERKSQSTMEHLSDIQTHLVALNDHVATLLNKPSRRHS